MNLIFQGNAADNNDTEYSLGNMTSVVECDL
jgi:hypothetical protein